MQSHTGSYPGTGFAQGSTSLQKDGEQCLAVEGLGFGPMTIP